ncbi:hypothetical protein DL96DRAFT_1629475, partial [Flagelloscypha sp. PMI_526]
MANSFPLTDLPVELQGNIFQCAAAQFSSRARIDLMLVSKMAYEWVSYVHYDTIVIQSLDSFESFLWNSTSITFLSTRVRAIAIKITVYGGRTSPPCWIQFWCHLLPSLLRVQYLEIWDSFRAYTIEATQRIRNAVVPALKVLPVLSYLGIHSQFLWEQSTCHLVKLPSVTHLKLFRPMSSVASLPYLRSFPSLTHLMVPLDSVVEKSFSEHLASLEVLIVGVKDPGETEVPNVVPLKIDNIYFSSDIPTFKDFAAGNKNNVWRNAERDIH